ncbi:hypothetical protein AB3M83_04310 [Microbacterium sp. 179-B 1A2 NHS]|uniref:hypothetical protein n=1 Tax=Microbacterium sp. 179-B 1A2 NHS TaxID=3142383 RepID=UPI0039A05433
MARRRPRTADHPHVARAAGAAALVTAWAAIAVGCAATPTGAETGLWEIREPPTADSTSIDIAVTRLECASGVTGDVLEPEVTYERDRILIATPVADNHSDAATCQDNDAVPITVVLTEPVGDRLLIDAACLEPEAGDLIACEDDVRWRP